MRIFVCGMHLVLLIVVLPAPSTVPGIWKKHKKNLSVIEWQDWKQNLHWALGYSSCNSRGSWDSKCGRWEQLRSWSPWCNEPGTAQDPQHSLEPTFSPRPSRITSVFKEKPSLRYSQKDIALPLLSPTPTTPLLPVPLQPCTGSSTEMLPIAGKSILGVGTNLGTLAGKLG